MIHVSCDGCGKPLDSEDERRYSLCIEARPVDSPWELTEADLEADALEKVSELLQQESASLEAEFEHDSPRRRKLDLCADCCRRFLKNPLASLAAPKFNFSPN